MNQTHERIAALEAEVARLTKALANASEPLVVGIGDVLCPICKMRYGRKAWELASGRAPKRCE